MKYKQRCEQQKLTSIETSNESHLYWKEHFRKNSLYFRIYADFEADNENDSSSIGTGLSSGVKNINETTNIYEQNPVSNGYYIRSELNDVLRSVHYESTLRYKNVDWFVDEIIQREKWLSSLKTLKKIIL